MTQLCAFCVRPHGDARVRVPSNPGGGCTYGLDHEFPEAPKPQPAPKRDTALCVLCGLHPKNPKSATNGCEHKYE